MNSAARIRLYIRDEIAAQARQRGERTITLRAGEIAAALGLTNHLPIICRVVQSDTLYWWAKIRVLQRQGPPVGPDATWTLDLYPPPKTDTKVGWRDWIRRQRRQILAQTIALDAPLGVRLDDRDLPEALQEWLDHYRVRRALVWWH